MEVIKALVKMGIIGTCAVLVIRKHLPVLMGLGGVALPLAWATVLGVLGELAAWCALFLIIGMIDWRYQAWELEKQLRYEPPGY